MSFYCISVKTGMEEKYAKTAQEILNDPQEALDGTIHFLRKKMRLKNGKEYMESIFPGYVFFETAETNSAHFKPLEYDKNFLRFLPSNQNIEPLADTDLNIITSILSLGSTVGILRATFDKDDRIVITDGPFKDFTGKVVSVNRRNKRVNIAMEFMGSSRIVSLSYELVKKTDKN